MYWSFKNECPTGEMSEKYFVLGICPIIGTWLDHTRPNSKLRLIPNSAGNRLCCRPRLDFTSLFVLFWREILQAARREMLQAARREILEAGKQNRKTERREIVQNSNSLAITADAAQDWISLLLYLLLQYFAKPHKPFVRLFITYLLCTIPLHRAFPNKSEERKMCKLI